MARFILLLILSVSAIGLSGSCRLLHLDLGWAGEGAAQCPQVEVQPMVGGKTFVTWVPSEAAPDKGIVVRLIYPDEPRYPEGTAAVVKVPGADTTGGVELPRRAIRDPLVEQGLIKVSFAFPGGGRPPLQSGGVYDHRGMDSLKAVRDVVRFLQGELREQHGCSIDELLPYPIIQVGLFGSSNGGNTAVVALGLFGDQMSVDWYVGWENPAGVQFVTVDLGSRDQPNPAYIPGSCRLTPEGAECDVDYSQLRWDPEAVSRGWGPQRTQGVLYHDLNGNGRYDEADYVLGAYTGTFDGREKRVYSTAALEAAVELGLFDPWPANVATPEEARGFWAIRDMSRYYDEAVEKLPELRAIVLGSVEDHVQATPDHPHIVLQYQGWQEAGIQWVRLNPDAAYVELAAGRALPAADNPANAPVGYDNIRERLQPEAVPDRIARLAAVLELADRSYYGVWAADLEGVLSASTPDRGEAWVLDEEGNRIYAAWWRPAGEGPTCHKPIYTGYDRHSRRAIGLATSVLGEYGGA